MTKATGSPVSVRLDAEVISALKLAAEQRGETFSDVVRSAALIYLGKCPTCGHEIERKPDGNVD